MFVNISLLFVILSWSIDSSSCYHGDQMRRRGHTRLGSNNWTPVYDSENGGDYDRGYDDYSRDRYYTPSRGQYKSRREGSVYDSRDRTENRRGYPYPDKYFLTGIDSNEFQESKGRARFDSKTEITSFGQRINFAKNKKRTDQLGKRLSAFQCGNAFSIINRIVGGQDALEGAHPWIVSVRKDGDHYCGGSIIAADCILSAAHCFSKVGVTWSIRVGSIEKDQGRTYEIKEVITHENFTGDVGDGYDIALLITTEAIEFSMNVKPICLPGNSGDNVRTSEVIVAGWGRTSWNGDQADFLQEVNLTVTSVESCAEKWSERNTTIFDSQLCTWDKDKDACKGDSGGPVIELVDRKATLVGLVSYGLTCADDFPGVYTKVSHFLDWISLIITGSPNYKRKSYPNNYRYYY